MQRVLLLCSILALAASKPNGYYHQEYNYKSSSSSFKNNELQHKTDDQGFYSKDGDLDGRVKPKVDSHSQHSEYTNPKLTSGSSNYQAGYNGGSSGNYLASSDRLFGTGQNAFQSNSGIDGYASSDRVLDLSNIYRVPSSSYGSSLANQGYRATHENLGSYGGRLGSNIGSSNTGYTQGGSSYGYIQSGSSYGSSGSYRTNANLNSVGQRVQDELARQLEANIQNKYRSGGYTNSVSSSQMTADMRALEDDLKKSINRQLEDSIRSQYGQQVIRGSNSYTLVDGRPSAVVNFNNQELADMTRKMENTLMNKLHQDMQTVYRREMNSYLSSDSSYQHTYTSSTVRPSYDRPVLISPSNIRYTPVPNPVSITQIASSVQTDVNSYLDTALSDLYSRYIQSGRPNHYTLTDFDNEVHRIKNEILRKLTSNLDDQIRRNYGHQVLKGDYYYSTSSNGDTSSQHNYNLQDYENLRRQVEDHLIRKLNQTVETYKTQYQRQVSYSTSTTTANPMIYRPTYYNDNGNQQYDYSDIQRRLSQQVQNALDQHRYSQSSYSSSSSYNPQAYQTSLDALSQELRRNLTEQLNNLRTNSAAGSASSYGYTSGGSSSFEAMKHQLENQLMQQLQQGLQKQQRYSASASYSASSSAATGSGYGSHQSYGNYEKFVECCQPISTSGYNMGRRKRSLPYGLRNSHQSYRGSFSSSYGRSYSSRATSQAEAGSAEYFNSHRYPSESKGSFQSHSGEHLQPDIVEDLSSAHHIEKNSGEDQQLVQHLDDDLQQSELSIPLNRRKNLFTQQDATQQIMDDDMGQHIHLGFSNTFPTRLQGQSNIDLQHLEEDPTQQLEHRLRDYHQTEEDLTQKLELENLQPHHYVATEQLLQRDRDLSQQLELTDAKIQIPAINQQDDLNKKLEIINSKILKAESLDQQLQEQDNLARQLKFTDTRHPNQDINQQLLEQNDLTQKLEPITSKHDQHPNETDDLTQQLDQTDPIKPNQLDQQLQEQDVLDQQLELAESKKNKGTQDQQLQEPRELEQESQVQDDLDQKLQEPDNLEQQLELNSRKPEKQIDQQLQKQEDLEQQPQQSDDLEQQLDLDSRRPKPKQIDQQSQVQDGLDQQPQEPDNLEQQLELDSRKPKKEPDQQLQKKEEFEQQPQQSDDLEQQLELDSRKPKPKQIDQQSQVQDDLDQQSQVQDDLDQQPQEPGSLEQQLELDSRRPKPKQIDQQLQMQDALDQQPDNLVQQLELDSRKPKKQTDQQLQKQKNLDQQPQQPGDLELQLELDSRKPKPKQIDQQSQMQDDLDQQSQEPDNLEQQLERDSKKLKQIDQQFQKQDADLNKAVKFRKDQQLQELDDLTQQLEKQIGQLQLTDSNNQKPRNDHQLQELDDLTQQLEKQIDQQLQLDDLTQQLERQINQQLELADLKKPKTTEEQQLQVTDILTQQLELDSKKSKPKQIDQQLQKQDDLDQQLEFEDLIKQTVRKDQQLQELDDLTQEMEKQIDQQLELADLKKPKSMEDQQLQETDDLTQKLELDSRNPKPKKIDQQLELADKQPNNDHQPVEPEDPTLPLVLTNSAEQSQSPKLAEPDQKLQNQDGLTQQLEVEDLKKPSDIKKNLSESHENLNVLKKNLEDQSNPLEQDLKLIRLHGTHKEPLVIEFCAKLAYLKEKAKHVPLKQLLEKLSKPFKMDLNPKDFDSCQDELENRKDQLQKAKSPKYLSKILVQILTEIVSHETTKVTENHTQQSEVATPCVQKPIIKKVKVEPLHQVKNVETQTEQIPIASDPEHTGFNDDFNQQFENSHPQLQLNPQYLPENDFNYQSHYSASSHPHIDKNMHQSTHLTSSYGHTNYNQQGFERPFTNGHSGHTGNAGINTDTNFEHTLRQQDALLDLLRQKVSNQVNYSHRTASEAEDLSRQPVDMENFQHSIPSDEILPSQSTDTFPQQVSDGHFTTYGQNPLNQITRQSSYFTHTGGNSYHVNENPASSNIQYSYIGRLPIENTETPELPPDYSNHFYNNGLQNTEYSSKATRRTIHYVNGKPISASENVQIFKPNGQIIETKRNLPLDGNLVNEYTHGLTQGGFSLSHPSYPNYGPQLSSNGHTRRTYFFNGGMFGSSESHHLIEPQVNVGDFKPQIRRILEKQQTSGELEQNKGHTYQPSSKYSVKTSSYSKS